MLTVTGTVPAVELLFTEELGLLCEVSQESLNSVIEAYSTAGVVSKSVGRSFHKTPTNTVRGCC